MELKLNYNQTKIKQKLKKNITQVLQSHYLTQKITEKLNT